MPLGGRVFKIYRKGGMKKMHPIAKGALSCASSTCHASHVTWRRACYSFFSRGLASLGHGA
ncbi:hypothetical protein EDD55_102250 [Varunaivibrio sulfuroxidans]|uniref:Uncharacterized protein n=1 Tax=Varunaivibrio sulfuroxidans TaxID=1773489 RepID=A0A4R3JDU4_9PROT|nr:hypothetical protein EDD55_102250 [Varunaivibrio sulfuroxidans]